MDSIAALKVPASGFNLSSGAVQPLHVGAARTLSSRSLRCIADLRRLPDEGVEIDFSRHPNLLEICPSGPRAWRDSRRGVDRDGSPGSSLGRWRRRSSPVLSIAELAMANLDRTHRIQRNRWKKLEITNRKTADSELRGAETTARGENNARRGGEYCCRPSPEAPPNRSGFELGKTLDVCGDRRRPQELAPDLGSHLLICDDEASNSPKTREN
ncbi:hypothetical protein NL676_021366 [Syzygium grande]|nr:hypothetical protein NL676_021366 [Syzygium grande]